MPIALRIPYAVAGAERAYRTTSLVLTQRTALPVGDVEPYEQRTRLSARVRVASVPIGLGAPYAMSGTESVYGATRGRVRPLEGSPRREEKQGGGWRAREKGRKGRGRGSA
eukprot:3073866-Rhodomonas_salina.2